MIKTVSIVIINNEGKILALKRSALKKWYPAKWDIISGKFEENETPEECFKRELYEETGITEFILTEIKEPYIYSEAGLQWLVHSFLCKIDHNNIKLDAEHSEFKWMDIKELLESDHATPLKTELRVFFNF